MLLQSFFNVTICSNTRRFTLVRSLQDYQAARRARGHFKLFISSFLKFEFLFALGQAMSKQFLSEKEDEKTIRLERKT